MKLVYHARHLKYKANLELHNYLYYKEETHTKSHPIGWLLYFIKLFN